MKQPENQPYFPISVVAEMLNLHPQTIRNYERMGLIEPMRTSGNIRLFSWRNVEKLKKIQSYTSVGVNLAGVEIIIKLLEQINELQDKLEEDAQKSIREMEEEMRQMQREDKDF